MQGCCINVPNQQIIWGQGVWTEVVRLVVATAVFTLCFRYLPRRSSSWLGVAMTCLPFWYL